jgi:hypothetical protein
MMTVQIFFATLLAGPIIWGAYNVNQYKNLPPAKGMVGKATLINSAIFYALAYNSIFFLQELFLVLGKRAIGLKSFLYHNNHTWEGEHVMSSLMQGSGALAIFIIGLISLVIFRFLSKSSSEWKLFIAWLSFHGLMQSIPQVIFAALDPGTDVGEALVGYLNLGQNSLIVLAGVSTLFTALISIWFCRLLLGFIPMDSDLSNPRVKFKYILAIAVGGALMGSVLVVPFRILPMRHAITPFLVFIFTIPWTWSAAPMSRPISHAPTRINEKIFWIPAVLLVLLLLFFQMILAPGVEL